MYRRQVLWNVVGGLGQVNLYIQVYPFFSDLFLSSWVTTAKAWKLQIVNSLLLSIPVPLTSIHFVNPFFTYFLSDVFSICVKQVASYLSVLFHILQFKHWKLQEDSYNWQIIEIFRFTLGLNLAKYSLLRLTQTGSTTKCNLYVWKVLSCQRQVSHW